MNSEAFKTVANACQLMFVWQSVKKRLVSASEFVGTCKWDRGYNEFYLEDNLNPIIWVDDRYYYNQRQQENPTSFERGQLLVLKHDASSTNPVFKTYDLNDMLSETTTSEGYNISVEFLWEILDNGQEKIVAPDALKVKLGGMYFTIPFDLDSDEFDFKDFTITF